MTNANYEVIADLLIQLGTAMKKQDSNVENIVKTKLDSTNTNSKYLTRKEVLEMYSPVITDYGLRQAINIDGFPCIKRGKQYFFTQEAIDNWLSERTTRQAAPRASVKYV